MPETVAQRLARYVCDLSFADVPHEVVAHTKAVVAHDLVVGVVGSAAEEPQAALRFIHGDAGSDGNCTVIRQQRKASVLDAAFANAVMIRALRHQSTLLPAGIHGGAIMIPVALALAEQLRRSGRDILTALIAGFDVCGKLDAVAPDKRMIRTASHVYGAFGSAAVAAKLMQLDRAQTTAALSWAGNLAVMIQAGFGEHNYGVLARNGLMAAYFAQAGAPAEPAAIEGTPGFYQSQLGGPPGDFKEAFAGLGAEFEVMKCVCKAAPGGTGGAVGLEIFRWLVVKHRLRAERVARIVIHRPPETNDDWKHARGPFADSAHSLSSVPLSFAALLVDGELTAARLLRNYNDPEVLRVAHRVVFEDAAPDAPRQRIEVQTVDGEKHFAEGDRSILAAPGPEDIVRFHASQVLDAETAAPLIAVVRRLEQVESVRELTSRLAAA